MTDDERQQLDNLEKNLIALSQTLAGQVTETKKQLDALTIEGYRIEGGLRLLQTIKAMATTQTTPLTSTGLTKQKERKNEEISMHPGG